jgi:hypothetical protein
MTTNPPNLLPPELEPLRAEMATYYKELPRLLKEGEDGKYVVVKGETIHWVWDTYHDALQYAYDRFGVDQRFLCQKIDRRFLAALEPVFGPLPEPEPESA